MTGKIKEINVLIEPIKQMEEQYISMQAEMTEANKEITRLKKELAQSPSFEKTKELSILEDSYKKYGAMCQELAEKINQAKTDVTDQLKRIANRIVCNKVSDDFKEKREETTLLIHEAARTILTASQELNEFRQTAIEQAINEVEEQTNISRYFDSSNTERYPNFSHSSSVTDPKMLSQPFKDCLENIEDHYI